LILFGLKDVDRNLCLPDPGTVQHFGYRFSNAN